MRRFLLFTVLLFISSAIISQTVPELVFMNPVLESGTPGADGAKYRFSNVATNLDAVVEINGRSSVNVTLSSMDTTGAGLGYDKAFQPTLGIAGTAPANSTWWMSFKMTFYKAGTNNKKNITKFYVTGLDIDGDGQSLSEWTEMDKITSIDSAWVNSLTFTKLGSSGQGDDYKVEGIVTNAPGIDTTATNVMATYRYDNKDNIEFTIGARTGNSTTSAGQRLNSLWFKYFIINPALPVKLVSFTAMLNDNKADLKWTSASEINVSHYVIEKSYDGKNFQDAAVVFAYGSETEKANYSYSDNLGNAINGIVYYRLHSVDIDKKGQYSDTRIIRVGGTEKEVTILTYPNPTTHELRITIPSNWQNKKVSYELFNYNGQLAKRTETPGASQTQTLDLSKLTPGFYIVKVSCNDEVVQQRIIKQ